MSYYRVITPAGHLAPGMVVTDERPGSPEQGALFALLPQTARKMVASGALEPLPDPAPQPPAEPGWSPKEAQQGPRAGRRVKGKGKDQ